MHEILFELSLQKRKVGKEIRIKIELDSNKCI